MIAAGLVTWLALACAVVALIPWLVLGVTVPRFWRKVEPQVRPLLSMFAPPTHGNSSSTASSTSRVTDSPPEIVDGG